MEMELVTAATVRRRKNRLPNTTLDPILQSLRKHHETQREGPLPGGSGHSQERHGGGNRHHAGNAHLAHFIGGGGRKAAQRDILLLFT